MMRIVCISDTHNHHRQIEQDLVDGDVIIHSGDMTSRGVEYEVVEFLQWFSNLKQYKHKILIAGNHDFLFDENKLIAREILSQFPNIIYLEDSFIKIDGVKFYGSPHQPTFFNWAFNVERGEKIRRYWELIPNDVDILITHGPAYGYGDIVSSRIRVGCVDLRDRILEIQPIYHICGHIHEGYGIYKTEGTTFINASMLDKNYEYTNKPILIEINNTEF